jgi:hypothetical protein
MPDHAALTDAFAHALVARSVDDAPVGAFAGDATRVRERLRIYRGNVQAGARKALRAAYPVVERIVGDAFFDGLANAYAAAAPSKSGDLNEYGDALASFLASFPHVADLPYLPDVAALEWRVHRAHYAADAAPLDPARLAGVPEDRYAALRFAIAPGVAIVESRWPVARIWKVHQPDFDDAFDVDLDAGPERALVFRPRFRVDVRALSAGACAFVRACEAGASLGEAVARAMDAERDWGLDAGLAQFVADRVLVDFAGS